jgi:carbohydrate-binding DOMON domain-containing protein
VSNLSWKARCAALAMALGVVAAAAAAAQEVSFKDPTGDDNGPGKYTYPTDQVYKPGSFDLTGFSLKVRGDKVDVDVSVAATLEDPWKMGTGFSVQMVFIFIKTQPSGGFTQGLPGLNVQFAPEDAWDRCIILSPQAASRVRGEVETKAAAMKDAIVIPGRVKGSGHTISATVDRKALGDGDPTTWGYQVAMQSNEGFPAPTDLLTRKVNEYEGQHRFGGGNDGDCDPHVMDVLDGPDAKQSEMLAYTCGPNGESVKKATLKMIKK